MGSSSDKYSDPKLRDEIKEEIQNSDKGGAPGQWSARKAQFMAQEYKKRGGEYKTDKSQADEKQQHLQEWTKEDWQTSDGSGNAKQEDGTQRRYLPKKAWDKMTDEEKEETEKKKLQGSKQGKQFVGNTDKAKQSREEAQQEEKQDGDDGEDDKSNSKGKTGGQKQTSQQRQRRSTRKRSSSASEEEDKQESAGSSEEGESNDGKQNKKQKTNSGGAASKKRAPGSKNTDGTYGSKHGPKDPPEGSTPASKDNLPRKGQQVYWKAMSGICSGKVTDILTRDRTINGRTHKATADKPKIVAKSDGPSKKTAVHNVDKVWIAAH